MIVSEHDVIIRVFFFYFIFPVKKVIAERFLDDASDKLYLVTDCMIHALNAWWPWRRYLPGWDAKLMYKPLSMLPAFITDNMDLIFRIEVPIPKACKK